MQLKLAEYNSEGKFERFLEIGKDFGYYGNYINIKIVTNLTKITLRFNGDPNTDVVQTLPKDFKFTLDIKDPLNRFDGLFNGFTYGNGRFVLEVNNRFNVYTKTVIAMKKGLRSTKKLIGNLHKNPELYEKVKNAL